jgi:hypothetical protein
MLVFTARTTVLAYKNTHHHLPVIVLSTDALSANGRPVDLGAVHADKSSTPAAWCHKSTHHPPTKPLTHFELFLAGKPHQVRVSGMGSDIQQKFSPSLRAYRITHQTLVNLSR